MATKRRTTRSSSRAGSNSSSSSFSSVLVGLIIGLTIAAIAAFTLTRTPVPLQDKSGRTFSPVNQQSGSPLVGSMSSGSQPMIDPNAWLRNDGRISSGQPATGPTGGLTPIRPLTPTETAKTPTETAKIPAQNTASPDQIGSLINQLPADKTVASKPAPAPAKPGPVFTPQSKEIPLAAAKTTAPNNTATTGTSTRYLQVGAFRNAKEADATRARMILMGYNAEITKATINNVELNRVRIGPFKNDAELNRSRTELGKANISTTIVR